MELLTKELRERLIENAETMRKAQQPGANTSEPDHWPVVKLFLPAGSATWLLTELHIDDDGNEILFGLCDLGMGEPELGYVLLSELQQPFNIEVAVHDVNTGMENRLPHQVRVERDLHFEAKGPLSEYTKAASKHRHITEDI